MCIRDRLKNTEKGCLIFYFEAAFSYYWGRGNGWMAAGMTELLQCLPKNHKDRPRILEGYRTMMESLKTVSYTHLGY